MKPDKQENFGKRAAKGMAWWFAAEVICTVYNMCMVLLMSKFMALKIFAALSSMIIMNGLLFNYTYNCAVRDKNLIRYHGGDYDKHMGLKIALAAPLPQYIMWIVLLLSKLGVIKDIFNYYILANMQTLAWVDLFTDGRTIDCLSWGGLFGLLLIILVAPAVIMITYECTIKEVDLKAIFVYGKKK